MHCESTYQVSIYTLGMDPRCSDVDELVLQVHNNTCPSNITATALAAREVAAVRTSVSVYVSTTQIHNPSPLSRDRYT